MSHVIPHPTPIAVNSCVYAVSLSAPCAVEWLHTTFTFVHARMLMTTMISAATGTVYFSNEWIR